ncbi:MAG: LLM class flavin-dependent oxidoreductase [Acidimicrobiia bacterium]|nr:LLM class flavin-dependent oxidoreductase [Acidimicrobiia bacterium]
MRWSLALSQRLGRDLFDHAAAAADLGFDGLFVFDHLVPLADPHAPALEAATALGALAATSPLRVGSLVLRATMRAPEVTAAIAKTVAEISPVPPVIGLGAGDRLTKDETTRFGLPFPTLDERIEVLGAAVDAVQAAGVSCWVGGLHPRVREVALRADGWNLWEPDPTRLPDLLGSVARPGSWTVSWGGRALVGAERDDVWLSGDPGRIAERIDSLASAGIDELVIAPLPPTDLAAIELLASVRDR